jgi:hypothetical protein
VRGRGYALAPEEALLGVNALAGPVYDHRDALVASVALVGSIQHIAADPDPGLLRTIVALAARASRLVGSRPRDDDRAERGLGRDVNGRACSDRRPRPDR